MKKNWISLIFFSVFSSCNTGNRPSYGSSEWREYLGGPERNHYSPLDQINAGNVHQLKVAWEYHTLDSGQIQCNAIIVNGILYGMTALTRPFAVDAATGKEVLIPANLVMIPGQRKHTRTLM